MHTENFMKGRIIHPCPSDSGRRPTMPHLLGVKKGVKLSEEDKAVLNKIESKKTQKKYEERKSQGKASFGEAVCCQQTHCQDFLQAWTVPESMGTCWWARNWSSTPGN